MYIPIADESISPDAIPVSSDYLGYGLFAILLLFAGAVSLYLRSRYPCLTLRELNKREESLDNAYTRALKDEDVFLYGSKLEDIARRRFNLKKRASQIRMRSLQLDVASSSIWRIYLGFHPKLVSVIVTWNMDTETLERDIVHITEFIAQRRLDSDVQLTTPISSNATTPNVPNDTSHIGRSSTGFCSMLKNICRRHQHRRPLWTAV